MYAVQTTAELRTEQIKLTDSYAKAKMARAIPGAVWDRDERYWVLPVEAITPRTAAVTLKLFPSLGLEWPELVEARDALAAGVRPFDNATPFATPIQAPLVQERLADEGGGLFEFQSLDLGYLQAVLAEHGGAYLGWERGLGKTLGACALIDATDAKRVLVVAPNTAKGPVWEPELARFLPKHKVIVLPNAKAKRERTLQYVREESPEPFVLVVHYEQLAIIGGKDGRGWNKFGVWDMVVADEVHRIKNPKAKMSRAIKKVPTKMKLALSGSIIENHAEELFSVLQWLFPDRYRSRWRDWNDRYLDYTEGGFGKVFVGIKLDKLTDLQEELGVFMVYRRKEDELDLPTRTDQTLFVPLSPKQREVYTQLVQTCMAQLPDESIVKAADGLAMLTKLRQVATGLDLLADEIADSSKLDLAVDLINDAEDEAFVVFCWYKATAYALAERLGEDAFVVTGNVKHEDRTDMIAQFQNGEGRVFIGTLSTLGESVNLQRASQAILLDRSWNPATNTQAEDRIFRMGQDKPVTITHIIAKDTVDEHRVLPTITNKEALRNMILGIRQ